MYSRISAALPACGPLLYRTDIALSSLESLIRQRVWESHLRCLAHGLGHCRVIQSNV